MIEQKKVKKTLNESRIIILAAQVLLGSQYYSIFQSEFSKTTYALQMAHIISFLCAAACFVLLVAPASYHRIVTRGQNTAAFYNFLTLSIAAALWPFITALIINLYTVLSFGGRDLTALLFISAVMGITFYCWYGVGSRKNV